MSERHAPGFADGLVAAGHTDVAKMHRAPEPPIISDQKFPSPDSAIETVARAIECHPDDSFAQAILGHATRHVAVVMLNGHQGPTFGRGVFLGVLTRCVVGVQIMRRLLRLKREKLFVEEDVAHERPVGVEVIEVAEMMTEESVMSATEGERAFELPSHGQGGPTAFQRQSHGLGGVTARAPQRGVVSVHHPHHRVVAADADRSIVRQEHVGDAAQTRQAQSRSS